MSLYRVTWTIDLEAPTPRAAAEKALGIQRDTGSIATIFDVTAPDGTTMQLDVLDAPDGAPCCPDPGCPRNPCTFPGYAGNH